MKLKSFLLPALAGIATAGANEQQQQPAEAYMIRQSKTSTTNPPSIPDELARAILLQRLSTPEHPSALGQLPASLAQDESVSYIRQFGKLPRPLFEETDTTAPSQLVIALSGVTDKHNDIKAAISPAPLAFTAPGLSRLPIGAQKTSCAFEQSINPENNKCWKDKTQYLEYDVTKDSTIIAKLGKNLKFLNAQALDGKLETTILLLAPHTPESEAEELRRRDIELDELVMAEEEDQEEDPLATYVPTADSKFNGDTDKPFHAFASSQKPAGVLPACFESRNACASATDGCSGHGQCVDRWEASGSTDAKCFFCHCMSTNETGADGRTGIYHWGGASCRKRDVSTPFWLFAGVSVALVATVTFSIGLLFSVGEEKLPGVIGAGVSRSK
ncbi:hypothetical protein Hte_012577 [Hypoxylon texense]